MGSAVVAEVVSRGHEVTADVRDAGKLGRLHAGAEATLGYAGDVSDVARLSTGQG